jgi:single-strand DNA-binding protein
MSEGLNKVMLLGTLGADPELRHTATGTPIMNLRMATNESWFDKQANERKEHVEWHTVVLFGNRAAGLAKILTKGSQVLVEGGLRTSSYEKDGVKRFKTEVQATQVYLAGGKRAADSNRSAQEEEGF